MRELDHFIAYERHLLAGTMGLTPTVGLPLAHRLLRLAGHFLSIGGALRQELPDPHQLVRTAVTAHAELAVIVSPDAEDVGEAVTLLACLQYQRLEDSQERLGASWVGQPPEAHLQKGFWNLAGLASEATIEGTSGGLLEEHAADCANYLVFTAFTCGAFDLVTDTKVEEPFPRGSVLAYPQHKENS